MYIINDTIPYMAKIVNIKADVYIIHICFIFYGNLLLEIITIHNRVIRRNLLLGSSGVHVSCPECDSAGVGLQFGYYKFLE